MKNILGLIIFILFSFTSFSQAPSFPNTNLNNSNDNTIFGYLGGLTSNGYKIKYFTDTTAANAAPYLKFTAGVMIKAGENVYVRNSDLSKWLLMGGTSNVVPPIIFYGVDSVTSGGTNILCFWSGGLSQCFTVTTPVVPSTGIDSIVITGAQLCYYVGATPTCYTITNTINNITNITNIIDSSITIFNNPSCQAQVLSGTATIDSLFVGINTDIYFSLGCRTYFIAAGTFPVTGSGANDFYITIYGDTSGNIGTIVGGTSPPDIQNILDPASQVLIKVYLIPAFSTTPQGVSTDWVYREGDDGIAHDNKRTVTSTFDSVYTGTAPYAGLHSLQISAMTSGQYFEWWLGSTYTSAQFQLMSWKLKLAATFPQAARWNITLYQDGSLATSNAITISNGIDGYNRTISGSYQFIASAMSKFNFILPTFNRVRVTFSGNTSNQQQWDDVKFQGDVQPVNTNTYVQTVNGVGGSHVIVPLVDTGYYNADTSRLILSNRSTGYIFANLPSLLSYMQSADSCIIIDTTNFYLTKTAYLSFNQNCGGAGGIQSVVAGTNVTVDNTDPLNPIVSSSGGGGGTTSYQTETASGATTFTFVSVPASYNDYIIFVNGAAIDSVTHYTTVGNVITILTVVSGDIVRFQRIK